MTLDEDVIVDTRDVQQLLLRASRARCVKHVFVKFKCAASGREFMNALLHEVTWANDENEIPEYEIAVGISFRGLQALNILDGYQHIFRHLAPAFSQGAAERAAEFLGDVGASAARYWDAVFAPDGVHAVITVHSSPDSKTETAWQDQTLVPSLKKVEELVTITRVYHGKHLEPPEKDENEQQSWHNPKDETFYDPPKKPIPPVWLHFGYRDGLTRHQLRTNKKQGTARNIHQAGELLLGEPRNIGDNPWSLIDRSDRIRGFFRHSSFGAFRLIEQDEKGFRKFVQQSADKLMLKPEWGGLPELTTYIRAKLCGRWPNGQVVRPDDTPNELPKRPIERNEFSYTQDDQTDDTSIIDTTNREDDSLGRGCPFGSHIRRMNPRDVDGVQAHKRPLFRRGVPYGPWYKVNINEDEPRGLLGLFFCSDLRNQFEHLLGEWADRKPLGITGDRQLKDPLIGSHGNSDSAFTLTRALDQERGEEPDYHSAKLMNFRSFSRTRGTVYCFYPSRAALEDLGKDEVWVKKTEEQWLAR
ncbi:MAG: hypothetical protein AB8B87_14145 [Granulosicoccus sp.]